ncbi:MAG: hypothetical protein ACI9N1_003190 [Flavobacteriales bacterium]
MKKTIINILKIIIPLFLGVYIFWYFWSSFDAQQKQDFFNVFKEADYFWVAIALVIGFISHWSRAVRWKYALKPMGYAPSTFNSYNAIMIGYIANILVPRMGEASRAGVLQTTEKVPFTKGFGSIVAERIIDVICLGIIAGSAFLFNVDKIYEFINLTQTKKESTGETGMSIWLIIAICVFVLGGLGFIYLYRTKPKFKEKFLGFFKGLMEGLFAIFKMKDRVPYLLHTVLIWTCYVGMFWVVFFATDFTKDLPISAVMIGFVAGTIGFIVTQGGIGTYPIMVGAVITFSSNPELLVESGLDGILGKHFGFGGLVWASQTVLIVILGLISLVSVQISKKKSKVEGIEGR